MARKRNPLTGGAIATVSIMTVLGAAWGFGVGKLQQIAERMLFGGIFKRAHDPAIDPEDITLVTIEIKRDSMGANGQPILVVKEILGGTPVEYELPNVVEIPQLTNLIVTSSDNLLISASDATGAVELVNTTDTQQYFRVDGPSSILFSVLDYFSDERQEFSVVTL